ncbi:retrovirus-related pol polyprotein from transposon TNT 1-94 [Tanacetum coccineum]
MRLINVLWQRKVLKLKKTTFNQQRSTLRENIASDIMCTYLCSLNEVDNCGKCKSLDIVLLDLQESNRSLSELRKCFAKLEEYIITLDIAFQNHKEQMILNDLDTQNKQLLVKTINNQSVEINDLKVQLQDKIHKIEDENVSLAFQVSSLVKEREQIKLEYKKLYDSIKQTRAKTKLQTDSLQQKLNDQIYENNKFRAQLKGKFSESQMNHNGKSVNTKLSKPSTSGTKLYLVILLPKSKVIPKVVEKNDFSKSVNSHLTTNKLIEKCLKFLAPGLLKIETEPINAYFKNNRVVHRYYLRVTKEHVARLQELLKQARSLKPLDEHIGYASKFATRIHELLRWKPIGRIFNMEGKICPIIKTSHATIVPLGNRLHTIRRPAVAPNAETRMRYSIAKKSLIRAHINSYGHPFNPLNFAFVRNSAILEQSSWNLGFLGIVEIVLWYLDSGCSKHMTGHHNKLINFVSKCIRMVQFGNDHFAAIMGYGDLKMRNILISRVYYIEGLGSRGSNLYTISIADMMKSSPICLLSKASKMKSWLWQCRLSHLNFDSINKLAKQGPDIHGLTSGHISSGLVFNHVVSKSAKPPTKNDWDLLFQPMFNEYFKNPCAASNLISAATLPPPYTVGASSSSSTSIDKDAPSPSTSPNNEATNSPINSTNVEPIEEVAEFDNDTFTNPFAPPDTCSAELSSRIVDTSNMHTFQQPLIYTKRWTKDHPLVTIIGDPLKHGSTRRQLSIDALWCYFNAFLAKSKLNNYKETMEESCWIDAMQEEIHEFERLKVWELVPRPDKAIIISLK